MPVEYLVGAVQGESVEYLALVGLAVLDFEGFDYLDSCFSVLIYYAHSCYALQVLLLGTKFL